MSAPETLYRCRACGAAWRLAELGAGLTCGDFCCQGSTDIVPLAAPAPAWSYAAPTAPGLYACQTKEAGARVTVVFLDDEWLSRAWKDDVRWFGPLPDPDAPWPEVAP